VGSCTGGEESEAPDKRVGVFSMQLVDRESNREGRQYVASVKQEVSADRHAA
jgi:hypothetical protein